MVKFIVFMGNPIIEGGRRLPVDISTRVAATLEQQNMLGDLRAAANTLRETGLGIVGVSGFSFNEASSVELAILRAARGCLIAARKPLRYCEIRESLALVPIEKPDTQGINDVHLAIRAMKHDFIPDSKFLSFIDLTSDSELVLGAINLQTDKLEIDRYSVPLQAS